MSLGPDMDMVIKLPLHCFVLLVIRMECCLLAIKCIFRIFCNKNNSKSFVDFSD